ncbi:MAG: hypothetical protein ACLR3U_02910 [Christensenellaceae bacterium]
MNEIKIYLKPSGSLAYLYKDFDLYEGCYRNSQLTVFVPKSLLYENENGTFVNLVKTGAILTAPNGSKLTTKSYYLDYEREQTIGGVEFRVYTTITPKEFCVYAGTQTVVVNVESIDNTTPDAQTIISVTTTQTADLIVLESAYLGQDEPIDPTELDKIKATLTEIQNEIGGLPNKYVTVDTNQTISGNKTHTGINVFTGFTSISGIGIDADAIVKGSDRFKYPVKSGTLALTSDIPENIVTTDTDQTIDGTKGFTSPITVGGQTWRTSYMKDSFVYTVDGYSYEVTYPEKSGLMALKSDIPTDYATQGQLAQTNQNVEDLYTILEQAQVVTVTTLEQAYTTRETADGENIVDGVQTTVKEIRGKTVATENLIPYPYAETTKTANGVTFTVNSDGSVTVNGTATSDADFMLLRGPIQSYSESYFLSGCPTGGSDTTYYISESFTASKDTGNGVVLNNLPSDQAWRIVIKSGTTVNNLVFRPMLNAGTTAKPYSKWFAGLKNASFEKIVSTGRNLIDLSGVSLEKTVNGVTFTKQADGQYHATGTIADPSQGASPTVNINQGKVYPAGVYSTARYTVDGKDIEFFVSAYSEKTGAVIRNIDGANVTINEDFVIKTAGIYVNRAITGVIDLTVSTMLNYGTSALPYEPYISDTLSAETPIELAEYDVAYPETGETKRQSKTVVFDGTEIWNEVSSDTRYQYIYTLPVLAENDVLAVISNLFVTNSENGISLIGETNDGMASVRVRGNKNERPDIDTLDKWKAYLAAQSAAGNPLTVTYKTAESTTESTPFNKSKYIAWKNGSETIEQGPTDNSEYGAENTVKQDYFTLTGGTTNV